MLDMYSTYQIPMLSSIFLYSVCTETSGSRHAGHAFSSIGLGDHGILEISLPWQSYFSYTIKLFSIRYLWDVFWLFALESVKESWGTLLWNIWWKELFKTPTIWLIGSFMKIPPFMISAYLILTLGKKWFDCIPKISAFTNCHSMYLQRKLIKCRFTQQPAVATW